MPPVLLPPIPQTGCQPLSISAEEQNRLLVRSIAADHTDLFATDPDPAIRTLGRLALRRGRALAADYFALGDLCARQTLHQQRLLVLYIGKTLTGYRRAAAAGSDGLVTDAAGLADKALTAYADWVFSTATQFPSAHNMAAALWLFADWQPHAPPEPYQIALSTLRQWQPTSATVRLDPPPLPDPDPLPVTQVEAPPHATSVTETGPIPADEQPTIAPAASAPDSSAAGVRPVTPVSAGEYRKGQRIGPKTDPERYEVYRLWRGGMGIVYAAYDRVARMPVAIKTIQTRLDRRAERDLYDRFIEEARTWITLEKHPHVVQALLVQTIAEQPCLVLEYVSGPEGLGSDLSHWIAHRRLDLPLALEIALHICRGMQHAVTRVTNLVHRDLKPANILVTTDAVAKVTDFGLAYAVQSLDLPLSTDHRTGAGAIAGTPQYLSPEQCRVETLDARSDIYALGIILYEMLTSRPLYNAHSPSEWLIAHQTGNPRFPDDLPVAAQIPAAVRDLVLRCLARQREDRPESWSGLAVELADLYQAISGHPAATGADGQSLAALELMDTGYSFGEIGHFDEALDAYSRALVIDPDSAWGWGRKGRTLRILKRYDEALTCFDRALALDPRYAWAANQRGIVLAQQGDRAAARRAYEMAAQLRPNDPWPWYNQAELIDKDKQPEAALALLDQAISVDPAHGQSHSRRGHLLRHLRRYPEALIAFDQALRYSPNDGWAWYGKGVTLTRLGRPEAAVAVLGHATRSSQRAITGRAWAGLAHALLLLARYDEALGAIQQAVRLRPDDAPGWAEQGRVLMRLRRYLEALAAFAMAVRLAPERIDYYIDQAEALLRVRRTKDALAALDTALEYAIDQKLRPNKNAWLWGTRAQTLRELGRYREAVTAYDRALKLAPARAWYWQGRGLALLRMNRQEDALESYARAVAAAPRTVWFRQGQIELLLRLKQLDDAYQAARQAVDDLPDTMTLWVLLGQVQRRLDRHEDALIAYDRALAIDPTSDEALTGKGLALAALDRLPLALDCHTQAVQSARATVWTWFYYAKTLMALRRFDDVINALDQGLRLNPTHRLSLLLRQEAILGRG